MVKVICAGFPKTGTKSLARALRILGYDKVYDFEEAVEFGFDEWEKVLDGTSTDIDEVLDNVYSKDVEAVVDFPHSYFFDEFFRKWPNAKVILATRDYGWFESIKNMLGTVHRNHFILSCMIIFSKSSKRFKTWGDNMFIVAYGSVEPRKFIWTSAYKRHNAYVRSLIPKEKLLEYKVQQGFSKGFDRCQSLQRLDERQSLKYYYKKIQGWEPICSFLGKDIPAEEFPFENKAGAQDGIVERIIENSKIVKQIKREAMLSMLFLSAISATLIFVFLL